MKNKKLILLSVMSLLMVCGCNNSQPTESSSASVNTSEDSSVSNSVGNTESSSTLIENQVLYVAPDVEDFNAPGTKEEPMMIQRAIALSHPGCTIYLIRNRNLPARSCWSIHRKSPLINWKRSGNRDMPPAAMKIL